MTDELLATVLLRPEALLIERLFSLLVLPYYLPTQIAHLFQVGRPFPHTWCRDDQGVEDGQAW
jgi:hypothetical protein